jgi:hypothetical protein
VGSPETATDLAIPVFETIGQAGLDFDKFILHGGSVLARYGIRPAHDVDLIVEPELFDEMAATRLTPGGIMLRKIVSTGPSTMKTRLLSAFEPAEGCLPLDMGTFSLGDRTRRFNVLREAAVKYPTDAGTLSHLTLENIHHHKSHSLRPRNQMDGHRIRRYMKRQGS